MVERQTLLNILEKHGGNRGKAAAELGISPVTLWRKLKLARE
jgi:transcriptional regulator with PAS, ATPase and Fis domain